MHAKLEEMNLLQQVFCCMFDGLCKYNFNQCFTGWNCGTEMVLEEDLLYYMWMAKQIMCPIQWTFLAGIWGLKGNYIKERGRNDWKRC